MLTESYQALINLAARLGIKIPGPEPITATFARALLNGPKIYRATATQIGTDAPIVTEFENTIGLIVWTRSDVGDYRGTLAGAFPTGKVWLMINSSQTADSMFGNTIFAAFDIGSIDYVVLQSGNINSTLNDDELLNTSIEIRVYP